MNRLLSTIYYLLSTIYYLKLAIRHECIKTGRFLDHVFHSLANQTDNQLLRILAIGKFMQNCRAVWQAATVLETDNENFKLKEISRELQEILKKVYQLLNNNDPYADEDEDEDEDTRQQRRRNDFLRPIANYYHEQTLLHKDLIEFIETGAHTDKLFYHKSTIIENFTVEKMLEFILNLLLHSDLEFSSCMKDFDWAFGVGGHARRFLRLLVATFTHLHSRTSAMPEFFEINGFLSDLVQHEDAQELFDVSGKLDEDKADRLLDTFYQQISNTSLDTKRSLFYNNFLLDVYAMITYNGKYQRDESGQPVQPEQRGKLRKEFITRIESNMITEFKELGQHTTCTQKDNYGWIGLLKNHIPPCSLQTRRRRSRLDDLLELFNQHEDGQPLYHTRMDKFFHSILKPTLNHASSFLQGKGLSPNNHYRKYPREILAPFHNIENRVFTCLIPSLRFFKDEPKSLNHLGSCLKMVMQTAITTPDIDLLIKQHENPFDLDVPLTVQSPTRCYDDVKSFIKTGSIFLGGIHPRLSDADFKAEIERLFGRLGIIESELIRHPGNTNRNRGFAFVCFSSELERDFVLGQCWCRWRDGRRFIKMANGLGGLKNVQVEIRRKK
jgi:hypothetical protein